MPGRLWFSLDEAKQELWKSPNGSSSSRSRAGDLRYLQAESANPSRKTGKNTLQAWLFSRSDERRNGGAGKRPLAPLWAALSLQLHSWQARQCPRGQGQEDEPRVVPALTHTHSSRGCQDPAAQPNQPEFARSYLPEQKMLFCSTSFTRQMFQVLLSCGKADQESLMGADGFSSTSHQ